MRRFFLTISILFLSHVLSAQVTFPEEIIPEDSVRTIIDEIDVRQDERLNKMLNWHVENNKKREGIEGFRVEIFFSSNLDAKENALTKKLEFLEKYPDYNVHVLFYAPNFRVRVGDFRTKNEAWKLYKQIEKDYRSAFVVKDIIDFPIVKPLNYE